MHEIDKMLYVYLSTLMSQLEKFCAAFVSWREDTYNKISGHFDFQHPTRSISCNNIRERTHVETVHCDTDCTFAKHSGLVVFTIKCKKNYFF